MTSPTLMYSTPTAQQFNKKAQQKGVNSVPPILLLKVFTTNYKFFFLVNRNKFANISTINYELSTFPAQILT